MLSARQPEAMPSVAFVLVRCKRNGDCMEWQGAVNSAGYGVVKFNGRAVLAHRLALFLARGALPRNRLACHTCDNPLCCEPSHLYAGTYGDNARDYWARKRRPSTLTQEAP
jgi:hypothetical protein